MPRQGTLKISVELFQQMFGIEGSCRIEGLRFDSQTGIIEVQLAGYDLPESADPQNPLKLIIRTEEDIGIGLRYFGHWEHAPGREWPISGFLVSAPGGGGLHSRPHRVKR